MRQLRASGRDVRLQHPAQLGRAYEEEFGQARFGNVEYGQQSLPDDPLIRGECAINVRSIIPGGPGATVQLRTSCQSTLRLLSTDFRSLYDRPGTGQDEPGSVPAASGCWEFSRSGSALPTRSVAYLLSPKLHASFDTLRSSVAKRPTSGSIRIPIAGRTWT
jgi:hypothetical protein